MSIKKTTHTPPEGSVVGTIHSPGSLQAALNMKEGAVDYFELRLDSFATETGGDVVGIHEAIADLAAPLIVTVRDPEEGAVNALSWKRRMALYALFLDSAAMIDVELRNARAAAALRRQAAERGVGVILSYHDFQGMPTIIKLKYLTRKAAEAGATVFKVAVMAEGVEELNVLMKFLATQKEKQTLAVMGMGPYGKISRLALGTGGSVLNYGYLDKLQVSGQWPAERLKELLGEIRQ